MSGGEQANQCPCSLPSARRQGIAVNHALDRDAVWRVSGQGFFRVSNDHDKELDLRHQHRFTPQAYVASCRTLADALAASTSLHARS
jgi:hypothetical protein